MKEEKIEKILNALSIPVITSAFLPVWIVVSSIQFVSIVPDPRILFGAIYASILTLSFVYFGLQLRKISE